MTRLLLCAFAILVCFIGYSSCSEPNNIEYQENNNADFVAIQEFKYNGHDYIKFVDAINPGGMKKQFVVLHSPDCEKCADNMKN